MRTWLRRIALTVMWIVVGLVCLVSCATGWDTPSRAQFNELKDRVDDAETHLDKAEQRIDALEEKLHEQPN